MVLMQFILVQYLNLLQVFHIHRFNLVLSCAGLKSLKGVSFASFQCSFSLFNTLISLKCFISIVSMQNFLVQHLSVFRAPQFNRFNAVVFCEKLKSFKSVPFPLFQFGVFFIDTLIYERVSFSLFSSGISLYYTLIKY